MCIHPEIDTAENHFYFEKNGVIQGYTERGRKTISIINLYRSALTKNRKLIYDNFYTKLKTKIITPETNNKEFYNDLITSANNKSEFSLFGKQICFQFEIFLYDEVISEIEDNKYEIYKNYIDEESGQFTSPLYEFDAAGEFSRYNQMMLALETLTKNLTIPFNIIDFSIKKFQGINNLKLKNIPVNTQWIFLTGNNGYGKTSILKAILLGLIGKYEFNENKIDENSRVELKIVKEKLNRNQYGWYW